MVTATSLAFLGAVEVRAQAAQFHSYSHVTEDSRTNEFTGLSVTRIDRAVEQATTGCDAFYSGNPIYQTQWVFITQNAQNWIELGTGHQCNDRDRFWFWGYGYQGDWYPVGEQGQRVNGESHRFRLSRAAGDTWIWQVDGNFKGQMVWSTKGHSVVTGLESWAREGVVMYYSHNDLQFIINQGQWTSWSGRDFRRVDAPEMCGEWEASDQWRAAQNRSC